MLAKEVAAYPERFLVWMKAIVMRMNSDFVDDCAAAFTDLIFRDYGENVAVI